MKPDDLTIKYEEDGEVLVEELDKAILSRGAWTTIMYMYREKNRQDGTWKEPKATIRRYKKSGDRFNQMSKFNVSNGKQARMVAATLTGWFPEEA